MEGFKLFKLSDRIYLLEAESSYELGMHFLRCQESYESINPKFKDGNFTILEYMSWYVKEYGQLVFSYPEDWIGFNIIGRELDRVLKRPIPDFNVYDRNMLKIHNKISEECNDYSLLGIVKGDHETACHEMAHALFYTNSDYKKKAEELVASLPGSLWIQVSDILSRAGYDSSVHVDECQAYFATGLSEAMEEELSSEDLVICKDFAACYSEFAPRGQKLTEMALD